MPKPFPSEEFFSRLRARIATESARFAKLGFFDVTFGVRVSPGGPIEQPRLFLLRFEAHSCVEARELSAASDPCLLDFVLEAPYPVWQAMLASLTSRGEIDPAHSINTLSHNDHPMRVSATDPLGHDKLFRYSESVQQVFNIAGELAAADGP